MPTPPDPAPKSGAPTKTAQIIPVAVMQSHRVLKSPQAFADRPYLAILAALVLACHNQRPLNPWPTRAPNPPAPNPHAPPPAGSAA